MLRMSPSVPPRKGGGQVGQMGVPLARHREQLVARPPSLPYLSIAWVPHRGHKKGRNSPELSDHGVNRAGAGRGGSLQAASRPCP